MSRHLSPTPRAGRPSPGLLAAASLALAATASVATASVTVLQVEADGSTATTGIQYAPVEFAGSTTVTSGGVTYYALSAVAPDSTYSGHAATVRDRLLAADGAANPVTDIYCLYASDLLDDYVKTAAESTVAARPALLGNGIKVVNNSWVGSYGTFALDQDAQRRMDYMIAREDLVWVSGAVTDDSYGSPLVWTARNGIAVRGTQAFDPANATYEQVGKRHADLWGPKAASGLDEAASYETPGVAGYAAGLVETATTTAGLGNAQKHQVVKSLLLTGADKTATTSNGFLSWSRETVNNLDVQDGAGRADYQKSLAVLTAGEKAEADVSAGAVVAPAATLDTQGWVWGNLLANGKQAVVVEVAGATLSNLTATLTWDVTQQEKPGNKLDTTDAGVIFANLDLELLPVSFDGSAYTLGDSFGIAGLMSKATDDNVEHLYYNTGTLAAGYYAFVFSNSSGFAQDYGFSYSFDLAAIPEPGVLALLALGGALLLRRRRR
ncbi:MAG: PEP-CTERM sorting domain-containing protein [Lentisphaeria bacterium]